MKLKTISEIKKALAQAKKPAPSQPATPATGPDVKKTFITIPFFTPSDDLNIDALTEEQKKKMVQKNKLMAGGDPITITKLTNRKGALVGDVGDGGWKDSLSGKPGGGWWNPADFTFDAGACYKSWMYTWIYLALTILTYVFIHPLLAVPFAWKVGHNQGHYIGGLIFGKEDMKGKTMYRTA